jgi:hypothetical protein
MGVGILALAVFGYVLIKAATFDFSKVKPIVQALPPDKEYADRVDVRRATEAALSDLTAKIFIARYDNPRMGVYVSYIPAEWVSSIKYSGRDQKINPEFAFLPDSLPVISVRLDSQTGIGVLEHPMSSIYLDPVTYKVYGSVKSFW